MSRYPGERWDRDRFEKAAHRPSVVERERYEEIDYYSRGPRRDRSADGQYARSYAPEREKERYGARTQSRPRAPARYYEEEEVVFEREMVPYRRERERERDTEIDIDIRRRINAGPPPAPRTPARPQFIRRQSSLDTFDRRPLPRYGDHVREEVVLPVRPRRRSPPRYIEREEIRISEPEYYDEDSYRGGFREREVETVRRRRPSRSETIVFEEKEEIVQSEFPKRGKTKMPLRLVNKRAVIELGYPYEEEGDTLIILKALGPEHIDEVIRISREYNALPPPPPVESRTTYTIEAPGPVPSVPNYAEPPPFVPVEEEMIKRVTKITREGGSSSSSSSRSSSPTSTAPSRRSHHHSRTTKVHRSSKSTRSKSIKSRRARSASVSSAATRRELIVAEDRETALIIPDRRRDERSERAIKAEIKALEAEKKALKYEREAESYRRGGGELIVEKDYRDGIVEVRKDKRAPDPRFLKAMLATLT